MISYVNVPGKKAPKEVIEATFSAFNSSSDESIVIDDAVGHGNKNLAKIHAFAPTVWDPNTKTMKSDERMAWLNLEIEGQPAAYSGGMVSKTNSAYVAAAYVGTEKTSSGETIHQLGMKCLLT